ncbi:hypothetical protein ACMT4L_16760 [Deinococcus sp. A31D244]|uniref:hypothetical protein n=1 Tax=Deinococcus sp. A31D244 TaxID=3397675 RepID=UPI0039E18A00
MRIEPTLSPEQVAALVVEYQLALTAERLALRLARTGRLDSTQVWRRGKRVHAALLALRTARM